jgi:hypothetical protein
VDLLYREGKSDPERGHFAGGVEEPEHFPELAVRADPEEQYDFNADAFVPTGQVQVQISGTRRALFEFGRYLIALSMLETRDTEYHDHFDRLRVVPNRKPCALIVRLEKDEQDAKDAQG